jgi:putative transposase
VHIHAYVLMTNHVHLLLTPQADGATSLLMQALGRSYVHYFNTVHQRTGTLWEGRFKSSLIETERYFLAVSRYIELNPVRAAMVNLAAEYPWSSYSVNAGAKTSGWLKAHPVYLALGANAGLRALAYKALFSVAPAAAELQEIRTALKKSWLLGSAAFAARLSEQTGHALQRAEHGGNRRSRSVSSALTP